jgi:hypothetical protein
MGKKIVHIEKSTLGAPTRGYGYKAVVNDIITGEELYNNSVWSSAGENTSFFAAISLWKSIVEKFGSEIELDNSKAPEITLDFLEKGINPREFFAVIKKRREETTLEINVGNKNLPIYRWYYREGLSLLRDELIKKIKIRIEKYNIKSIDFSEAPDLKQYF